MSDIQDTPPPPNAIPAAPAARSSNGIGIAGFVIALIGFIFCWVPILDWILWILGLVFSFIGVFKAPRGLAIAGLVISCIGLIAIIVFWASVGAAATSLLH